MPLYQAMYAVDDYKYLCLASGCERVESFGVRVLGQQVRLCSPGSACRLPCAALALRTESCTLKCDAQ